MSHFIVKNIRYSIINYTRENYFLQVVHVLCTQIIMQAQSEEKQEQKPIRRLWTLRSSPDWIAFQGLFGNTFLYSNGTVINTYPHTHCDIEQLLWMRVGTNLVFKKTKKQKKQTKTIQSLAEGIAFTHCFLGLQRWRESQFISIHQTLTSISLEFQW